MSLTPSASRVALLFLQAEEEKMPRTASMSKDACIVAAGTFNGSRCLLKNRDRNYEPELRVYHEIRNGVEILYVKDEITGWLEGLNDQGIGAVNAALMVGHDEAEKKLVKTLGKKSADGERILKLLEQKTLEDAVSTACTFKGGIKGHTFVSSPTKTVSIEQTSKHECVQKTVPAGKIQVRTNHGVAHSGAGYTDGADYISSRARHDQAKEVLAQVERPEDIAPSIYGKRKRKLEDPNNMVRDTDNMRTTSQLVLDLTKKQALLYLIPGKVKYLGYKRDLPKGYEAQLSLKVYEYSDLDDNGEFDTVRRKKDATLEVPSAARVAAAFKEKKNVKTQDGKEMTVYTYSDRHHDNAHKEKAKRVEGLRKDLPKLQSKYKKDLSSDDAKTRLTALAVALLDETYERIGNDGSAEENDHYGVTTWEKKHLSFSGGKAIFKYVGKSGVDHVKEVKDAKVVSALKDAVKGKKPGDRILCSNDEEDKCTVGAGDVNAYLKEFEITAKDMRGLHANEEMKERLKKIRSKGGKLPSDKKEKEKLLKEEFKEALEGAAEAVGHAPSMLRSSYLVPGMEEDYVKDGTVMEKLSKSASTVSRGDLKDALDHLSDTVGRTLKLSDFDVSSVHDMRVRDLPTDLSSWVEFSKGELADMSEDERLDALNSFRRGGFATRALQWISDGTVPPIVVVDTADAEELGDGRGRVNVAVGMGWDTVPVVVLKEKLSKSARAETPSGKWVAVTTGALDPEQENQIWECYGLSYKQVGLAYSSVKALLTDHPVLWCIDVDGDNRIDAFLAYKVTKAGFKITFSGHNGSVLAGHALAQKFLSMMKMPGWYTESSHQVAKLLEARGFAPLDDEQAVRAILQKDITWLGGGYYTRNITGVGSTKKAIYGSPRTPKTATKTESEKDDEEAERLIKPSPKYKPPRNDLARRVVEDKDNRPDDPDKKQDDKDRSKNYKGASASRVALMYFLKYGAVTKTDKGGFKAERSDGKVQYFKDEDEAKAWIEGGSSKGEADPSEDAPKEDGKAKEPPKNSPRHPSWVKSDLKAEFLAKGVPKEDVDAAIELMAEDASNVDEVRDALQQGIDLKTEGDAKAKSEADRKTKDEAESKKQDEKQEKARLESEAKEKAEAQEADPTYDPESPIPEAGDVEESTPKALREAVSERTVRSINKYRSMSSDQRSAHGEKLSAEIDTLEDKDPRKAHLIGVQRGIHIANALVDGDDAKGIGASMVQLIKAADKGGRLKDLANLGVVGSKESGTPDDQELIRSIYEDLPSDEWVNVIPEDHPAYDLAVLLSDPEEGKFLTPADRLDLSKMLQDAQVAEVTFLDPAASRALPEDASAKDNAAEKKRMRSKHKTGDLVPKDSKGVAKVLNNFSEFMKNLIGGATKGEPKHDPGDTWPKDGLQWGKNKEESTQGFDTIEEAAAFARTARRLLG